MTFLLCPLHNVLKVTNPQKFLKRLYSNSNIWLKANPRVCLHDVPTQICAGGLQPLSPVTFKATLSDENEKLVSKTLQNF